MQSLHMPNTTIPGQTLQSYLKVVLQERDGKQMVQIGLCYVLEVKKICFFISETKKRFWKLQRSVKMEGKEKKKKNETVLLTGKYDYVSK